MFHPAKNPAVKTNRRPIEQKIAARNGVVPAVTDLARGSFFVDHPERVKDIVDHLRKQGFGVTEEDWQRPRLGYGDKALNMLFPNGFIGEMQILHLAMWEAKLSGRHALYDELRRDDTPGKRKAELEMQSRELHGRAEARCTPDWRRLPWNQS